MSISPEEMPQSCKCLFLQGKCPNQANVYFFRGNVNSGKCLFLQRNWPVRHMSFRRRKCQIRQMSVSPEELANWASVYFSRGNVPLGTDGTSSSESEKHFFDSEEVLCNLYKCIGRGFPRILLSVPESEPSSGQSDLGA